MENTKNKCRQCKKNDALEEHVCPYLEDVCGDFDTTCNCCDKCQNNCAMEI